MDTRRDFLKKAALLTGGVGAWSVLPASIAKALAIDPALGSSFLDAEHVVFLMQENRSFDHCFGTLQGVRGYNDPRAIHLPNKNKVWLQSDVKGNTYAPFRLDIKNTKSTWTGNLPHSWINQTEARNNGGFDRWLEAKRSGYRAYRDMPLTLGYYNREDIPFYYAMADAFTICDQHFCSSLTGTTPNRLFFFTGALRANKDAQPNVDNENVDYGREANWETFPQLLEENGISWNVYQNEISLDSGLSDDEDFWLGNFTDNPLEWFTQHGVRFSKSHYAHCKRLTETLPSEIEQLTAALKSLNGEEAEKSRQELEKKKTRLVDAQVQIVQFSPEKFNKLTRQEQHLHDRAFVTNEAAIDYHELEDISIQVDGHNKELKVPKGDVFYQFRKDVNEGKLPTVSWLVAPQGFSDHPSSPWYGAWYVSEAMDILTRDPEVWKKTIFILTYDENDGYFDHIPPFVAPKPGDAQSGKVSESIDTTMDFVTLEQDILRIGEKNKEQARESPVGLGYRVPMIVASPWSRGGWVNSEVFDHTSSLQFLEEFLSHKFRKEIKKDNISSWRRAVCGNLASVFRKHEGKKIDLPFVDRNLWIESIQNAASKKLPDGYKLLNAAEIERINNNEPCAFMPTQERGIRNACAIPYELYVSGKLTADRQSFEISFAAANRVFGQSAVGAPFTVYAPGKYLFEDSIKQLHERGNNWSFAVTKNSQIQYDWPIAHFEKEHYELEVYGPNGFFRGFKGDAKKEEIEVKQRYQTKRFLHKNKLSGAIELVVKNSTTGMQQIELEDLAYHYPGQSKMMAPNEEIILLIPAQKSYGWYDCVLTIKGNTTFERRFAGRVETGNSSKTDPLMGRVLS